MGEYSRGESVWEGGSFSPTRRKSPLPQTDSVSENPPPPPPKLIKNFISRKISPMENHHPSPLKIPLTKNSPHGKLLPTF